MDNVLSAIENPRTLNFIIDKGQEKDDGKKHKG
jgi:hypothetical protein